MSYIYFRFDFVLNANQHVKFEEPLLLHSRVFDWEPFWEVLLLSLIEERQTWYVLEGGPIARCVGSMKGR